MEPANVSRWKHKCGEGGRREAEEREERGVVWDTPMAQWGEGEGRVKGGGREEEGKDWIREMEKNAPRKDETVVVVF